MTRRWWGWRVASQSIHTGRMLGLASLHKRRSCPERIAFGLVQAWGSKGFPKVPPGGIWRVRTLRKASLSSTTGNSVLDSTILGYLLNTAIRLRNDCRRGDFPFPFLPTNGGLLGIVLELSVIREPLVRFVEVLDVDNDSYLPMRSFVVFRRVGVDFAVGSRGREK